MQNRKVTREMAYLCIGDDLELVDKTPIYMETFKGVKYYIVDDVKLICKDSYIFSSCNEKYCWHVFKVALDKENAVNRNKSTVQY